ncbi:MAG: hypothetical protein KBD17_02850, partial [Candidatus Pacebacteria bacterium]|nr:hypothetical protein [Candidatus Paceibacterota bacterium]
ASMSPEMDSKKSASRTGEATPHGHSTVSRRFSATFRRRLHERLFTYPCGLHPTQLELYHSRTPSLAGTRNGY